MAFATANGWTGPEFFIVPGVRQKKNFNSQVKTHFPQGTIALTSKGYMTNECFLEWAQFYIEYVKSIRGDPNNWALLVLDGHSSHAYSLGALKILNSNNILVVGLPSHATDILQVHDVAVFCPLKSGFRKACSDWVKEYRVNFRLDDFPRVLAACWASANSSANIRSGFMTIGLWPLNLRWLEENENKLKNKTLSLSAKFERICQRPFNFTSWI